LNQRFRRFIYFLLEKTSQNLHRLIKKWNINKQCHQFKSCGALPLHLFSFSITHKHCALPR
jgi:hypothetical protein